MKTQTYFNTTHLWGEPLAKEIQQAKTQDALVCKIFEVNQQYRLSAELIHDLCKIVDKNYKLVPLTSVRRAISNLCRRGLIRRTETMKVGKYGKKIWTWVWAESTIN